MLKVKVEPVEPGLYGKVPFPRNPLTIAGYEVYCSEEPGQEVDTELHSMPDAEDDPQCDSILQDDDILESQCHIISLNGRDEREIQIQEDLMEPALNNLTVSIGDLENNVALVDSEIVEEQVIDDGMVLVTPAGAESPDLIQVPYLQTAPAEVLVIEEGAELMVADGSGNAGELLLTENGEYVIASGSTVLVHEEDTEVVSVMTTDQSHDTLESTIVDDGERPNHVVVQTIDYEMPLIQSEEGAEFYIQEETIEEQPLTNAEQIVDCVEDLQSVPNGQLYQLMDHESPASEPSATPKTVLKKKKSEKTPKKKKVVKRKSRDNIASKGTIHTEAIVVAKSPKRKKSESSSSKKKKKGDNMLLGEDKTYKSPTVQKELSPIQARHPTISNLLTSSLLGLSPSSPPSASPGPPSEASSASLKLVKSIKALSGSTIQPLSASPELPSKSSSAAVISPSGLDSPAREKLESAVVPSLVALTSPTLEPTTLQFSPVVSNDQLVVVVRTKASPQPATGSRQEKPSRKENPVLGKVISPVPQVTPLKKPSFPVLAKSKSPKSQRPVLVPVLPPVQSEEEKSTVPTQNKAPDSRQTNRNVGILAPKIHSILTGAQAIVKEQVKKTKKSSKPIKRPVPVSVPMTTPLTVSVTTGPSTEVNCPPQAIPLLAVPEKGTNEAEVPLDSSVSQTVKSPSLSPVQCTSTNMAAVPFLGLQSLTLAAQVSGPSLPSLSVVSVTTTPVTVASQAPSNTASSIQQQHQLVTSTLQARLSLSPQSVGETRETLADRYMKEWKPTGRFQCKLCFYSCVTHNFLFRHWVLNHCTLRPYMCGHCGFQSATRDGVTRHQTAKHRGNPRQVFIDTEQQELLWNKFDEMFQGSGFVSPNFCGGPDTPTDLSVPHDLKVNQIDKDHLKDENLLPDKPGTTILNVPVRQKGGKKGKKCGQGQRPNILATETCSLEEALDEEVRHPNAAGYCTKSDAGISDVILPENPQESNAAIQAALQIPQGRRHTGVCQESINVLPQAVVGDGSHTSEANDSKVKCRCPTDRPQSEHCTVLALSSPHHSESDGQQQTNRISLVEVNLTTNPIVSASQQSTASSQPTHPPSQRRVVVAIEHTAAGEADKDGQGSNNIAFDQVLSIAQPVPAAEDGGQNSDFGQQDPTSESPEDPRRPSKGNPESMFSLLQRTIEESFSHKNSLLASNKMAAPVLGKHQGAPNVTSTSENEAATVNTLEQASITLTEPGSEGVDGRS